MANEKKLASKQLVIDEVKNVCENSASLILFDYRGMTDGETKELRKLLRDTGSDYKVYKNTLMTRAFNDLKYDLSEGLEGPSALAYGTDQIAPVKVLSTFSKKHKNLIIKVGLIDGEVIDNTKLKEYATIPSRDGLLTMLAGGMIGLVRDLSICLDLYAKDKEEN